ncbi:MAG: hypothetical protein ABIO43_04870 [Sphingomicrobium sp.]
MPDLIIEAGTIRAVSPDYCAPNSGGQFPLGETARAWTYLWQTLQAVGWKAGPIRCSLPVRVSFKHGKSSYYGTLMPNPRFYEMIMGWPIGWTAPGAPVTGFAAWLRRSRGQFSNLLTSFRAEGEDDA